MATRTIVTCDVCKNEIKPGERIVWFSAARYQYDREFTGCVAKFDESEFCSDGCVIAAVRGLLNGSA